MSWSHILHNFIVFLSLRLGNEIAIIAELDKFSCLQRCVPDNNWANLTEALDHVYDTGIEDTPFKAPSWSWRTTESDESVSKESVFRLIHRFGELVWVYYASL